ncbi:hypothetical protein ACLOAU_14720 [Niabella sp. CJ426]|uniref:hypothetical protein n=1 Tax=Niabella sp. CJ426 TaxID=3393740 RepID=UPI003D02241B
MNDLILEEICKQVENDLDCSGLSDSIYSDYAKEVARRFAGDSLQKFVEKIQSSFHYDFSDIAQDFIKKS